jgi:hypothetical protein
MHHNYQDIIEATDREPLWWDEHGVPRFVEFSVKQNANIYADEVVLLRIACQACHTEFDVCMSSSYMDRWYQQYAFGRIARTLAEQIVQSEIHYGDPPNSGCCGVGATMNSVPRQVLQYWMRDPDKFGMKRAEEYEVEITPDWAEGIKFHEERKE